MYTAYVKRYWKWTLSVDCLQKQMSTNRPFCKQCSILIMDWVYMLLDTLVRNMCYWLHWVHTKFRAIHSLHNRDLDNATSSWCCIECNITHHCSCQYRLYRWVKGINAIHYILSNKLIEKTRLSIRLLQECVCLCLLLNKNTCTAWTT